MPGNVASSHPQLDLRVLLDDDHVAADRGAGFFTTEPTPGSTICVGDSPTPLGVRAIATPNQRLRSRVTVLAADELRRGLPLARTQSRAPQVVAEEKLEMSNRRIFGSNNLTSEVEDQRVCAPCTGPLQRSGGGRHDEVERATRR